jgi:tripartite-type tricarboxylate transporter receptor subunit TctC
MGTFTRNYPSMAIMKQPIVEGDPRRFNWLGATSFPGRICVTSAKAKVQTVADLLKHELIVGGGPGIGSSNSIIPTVINRVVGTKFRIIPGYKGTQDSILAIERGELEGQCASLGQFRAYEQLFKDKTLRIIFHAEESAMPDLPGVQSIYDYLKSEDQRQFMRFVFASVEFGRPYVLPPETPKDRVDVMRRALAEALKDPELVAEANKIRLDMTYRPPDHLERLVANLYNTPPALIQRVKELVPDIR